MKIGLIGIVGEESKRDFWGTMAQVAEMGYRGIEGVEGALLEGDPAANLARFRALGLEHLTVSASLADLRDRLDEVRHKADASGARRATVWWSDAKDRDVLLEEAELYNQAGAKLAADGIRLCYHNHDHEFRNVFAGVNALDLLATNTDPASVFFTIDVGWVEVGGGDPAAVLTALKGRVPAIHAKDFFDLNDRASFTAVGSGAVNFNRALPAAQAAGVEWVIVEQDRLRNLSAMETAQAAALNLRERGF